MADWDSRTDEDAQSYFKDKTIYERLRRNL